MTIIGFVLVLAALGVGAWFVSAKCPAMNATIKNVLIFSLVAIAIGVALYAFGVWDQVRGAHVPHV